MVRSELGAADLVRAAKLAYLRASVLDLKADGGRVSISRLSVVTGMTRKEVALLLRESPETQDRPRQRMKEHRALRVLRGMELVATRMSQM